MLIPSYRLVDLNVATRVVRAVIDLSATLSSPVSHTHTHTHGDDTCGDQISEWHLPNKRVKSKLEIDPARQMDAGSYECQANNKYTVDRKTFKADFVA